MRSPRRLPMSPTPKLWSASSRSASSTRRWLGSSEWVTDAGLTQLQDLKVLRRLDLTNTAVTDAGLSSLAKLAGLRGLVLKGTQVTDEGARRLAAHLGPIAMVLAKKDAKRAATLRDFYGLLAEHVTNPSDRERFLKEAGVQ